MRSLETRAFSGLTFLWMKLNKKKRRKRRSRKCWKLKKRQKSKNKQLLPMVSMDFVRVLALFGVILFHASGAYANIPYWSVQNGTSIVAIGIRELVDVFIMPLFFFLAGYFTLSSLRKKGSWGFFKSKFWELGFAWIVIVILVLPFSWWIVNRHTATGSYLTTWFTWIQSAGQTRLGVFETPTQSVHCTSGSFRCSSPSSLLSYSSTKSPATL